MSSSGAFLPRLCPPLHSALLENLRLVPVHFHYPYQICCSNPRWSSLPRGLVFGVFPVSTAQFLLTPYHLYRVTVSWLQSAALIPLPLQFPWGVLDSGWHSARQKIDLLFFQSCLRGFDVLLCVDRALSVAAAHSQVSFSVHIFRK